MSMTPTSAPGHNSQPEFTHAIQYINRIKTRFADEPETYKQFLEILQMYQKEQRVLQDVYDQVTRLFHNAPELIDEFKMFLPETNATANSNVLSLGAGMSSTGVRRAPHDDTPKDGPPAKRRRGAPPDKDSAGSATQQHTLMHPHGTVPPHVHPIAHVAITSHPPHPLHVTHGAVLSHPPHPLHVAHATGPPLSHLPSVQPIPPLPEVFFDRLKRALDDRDSWEDFLKLLTMYSMDVLDEPLLLQMATPFLGGTGSELEIMFRELLGVGIDGKRREDTGNANYIMNNAEIPRTTGHSRALGTFNSTGATAGMGSVYLTGSKYRFGSYRRLPESETKLACSGRDEICRSVLNDEWVSHPTWASEDSGFVAHKKNTYEEAMHKSEEERHEYHVQLEAMVYTISLLEPIALKISNMSPEEKAAFKLGPSLGGRSKSVHQKIIKKVYNRENASEVLQALQDNPAVSVPVVLERLKLVDAEWRKNKREWEKVWREVDARNFYKSLDHQGVSFKVNDKKTITGKALLAEIERIKGMQISNTREEEGVSGKKTQGTRLSTDDPRSAFAVRRSTSVQPRYQLQYSISDPLVLQDAIKLTLYFLERNDSRQGGGAGVPQYNVIERRRIEAFLRHYVRFQFEFSRPFNDSAAESSDVTITPNDFDLAFGPPITDEEWEELGLYIPDPAAGATKTNNNNGVFVSSVTEHGNGKGDSKSPALKDSIQNPELIEHEEDPGDIWIRHVKIELPKENGPVSGSTDEMVVDTEDSQSQTQQYRFKKFTSFFCNTTFYTLIRMLQLLYSRLLMCKELSTKLAQEKFGTFLPNPIAFGLGLTDLAGPLAYFGDLAAIMVDNNASSKSNSIPALNGSNNPTASTDTVSGVQDPHSKLPFKPAEHFYSHLLDLVEKLFDGELEQNTFEENMRFMFGTRAYVMFTLDKLCGAICKQVQAVVQDNRCHELMAIFEQQRKREVFLDKDSNVQDIIRYRRRAETLAGSDENLFRVDWNPEQRKLRIQLLDLDDPSLDPPETIDAMICGQSHISGAAIANNLPSFTSTTTPEKVSSKMTVSWKQYVESYVLIYPTERRRIGIERKVFLKRTLLNDSCEELNDSRWIKDVGRGGMEVMIGPGTYKLYYTRGCEEAGWRVSIKKARSTAATGENEKSGGGGNTTKLRGSGKKRRAPSNEEPEVETIVDEWERLKERAENRKRERRRWMVDKGFLTL